jgi:hypothetical protein
MLDDVVLVLASPVGTLGGVVSGEAVVTFRAVDWADVLPAASYALTV